MPRSGLCVSKISISPTWLSFNATAMLQLHATTPSLKERAAVKELVAVSNQLGAPAAAADHETGPRWLRAEQAATKDAKMLELVHLKVPSSVVPQPALFIASCANVHYVYMTLLDAQLYVCARSI